MAQKRVNGKNKSVKSKIVKTPLSDKELSAMIERLPDWAYEWRRKLANKYKGYKYWVDGRRCDGEINLLKTDGTFQWFLRYRFYKVCVRGKRTQFRSELLAASCIDGNGRYGVWNREEENDTFVAHSRNDDILISVPDDSDVLGAFKYANLPALIKNYLCSNDWKEWITIPVKLMRMYIVFPQMELIYRMEEGLRNYFVGALLPFFRKKEQKYIPDLISAIRLSLKHKNPILVNEIIYIDCLSLWWDCLIGYLKLGKDIRNPHYFMIPIIDLIDVHNKILVKLCKYEISVVPQSEKRKFKRLNGRYIGLRFEKDGLVIKTLDTPEAYIYESYMMHNCIATYKYYLKDGSLILCASKDGKRIADIELSLWDFRIVQCCGPCNRQVSEKEDIKNLIYENIGEIRRRKAA